MTAERQFEEGTDDHSIDTVIRVLEGHTRDGWSTMGKGRTTPMDRSRAIELGDGRGSNVRGQGRSIIGHSLPSPPIVKSTTFIRTRTFATNASRIRFADFEPKEETADRSPEVLSGASEHVTTSGGHRGERLVGF